VLKKVEVYGLDDAREVVKLGEIHLDGEKVTGTPADAKAIQKIMSERFTIRGDKLSATSMPTKWFKSLRLAYQSPYLWCTEPMPLDDTEPESLFARDQRTE
jgi:hypothetical protein